ncbi:MAG: hypothetical protein WBA17_08700 [Saprospiraceae bacterium]
MTAPPDLPSLFTRTLTGLQISPERQPALWEELRAAYTAGSRHYHNLTHLSNMVAATLTAGLKPDDPDLYYLALFYHDIVYNPLRRDNERRSADRAVQLLEEVGTEPARVIRCRALIEQTQAHRLTPAADGPSDRLFLDADLAILAAERPDYENYTAAVRREYWMYPDLLYRPGRAKVLRDFLERPEIYFSPHFRLHSEARARKNLTRELDRLTQ